MKSANIFQDILLSIGDLRPRFRNARDDRTFADLCRELLARDKDVASRQVAEMILGKYGDSSNDEKLEFFRFLADELDIDAAEIEDAAREYREEQSVEAFERLQKAAEPPRHELLRRLNQVPRGTEALVSMRQDLLGAIRANPSLRRVDIDFRNLLSSWFNRGFLEIRPISWQTPASILAKIIQYEAVHEINDWEDLRRRLQPDDRRCYAFFHPAMPDEPLVFVEVALCKGIPNSVQALLSGDRKPLEAGQTDTAAFYSISNCQAGLRGISFGNSLIKQVAADLSRDLPNIKRFVTLSPVPGFSKWLEAEDSPIGEADLERLRDARERLLEEGDGNALEAAVPLLRTLAAHYLYRAKRPDGLPLDPVARFHFNNGASLYDIHGFADISRNGLQQSYGLMVNYHYALDKVEMRHEDFARDGQLAAERRVIQLANVPLPAGSQDAVETKSA